MSSTGRVANFSAGPAQLPVEVLLKAQKEMLNYDNSGHGVMEMSHRSKWFQSIWDTAVTNLREILNVPKNYHVFFLQGGATSIFSTIPLNFNLRNSKQVADYIITGNWSAKAAQEAARLGNNKVNIAVDTRENNPSCNTVPPLKEWKLSKNPLYVHLCVNETVHGVLMKEFPNVSCPIIADYSSCFMSEPIDVSKFGIIYAGAQKNVGPAGTTICIVRDDLITKNIDPMTPILHNFNTWKKKPIYNTPPCYSIYMMGLVFKWLKNTIGGINNMQKINIQKAKLIYDVIDEDDFYYGPVTKDNRSLMNIRFNIGKLGKFDKDLEKQFIEEAAKLNMINLKGYRTLGGIRASVYNAQTLDNCRKLSQFMKDFRKRNNNQSKM